MGKNNCEIKLCGMATVGPKGQVVIPKEIREKMDIKPGDSFSVMLKDNKYIGFIRNDDISELMEYVNNNSN